MPLSTMYPGVDLEQVSLFVTTGQVKLGPNPVASKNSMATRRCMGATAFELNPEQVIVSKGDVARGHATRSAASTAPLNTSINPIKPKKVLSILIDSSFEMMKPSVMMVLVGKTWFRNL